MIPVPHRGAFLKALNDGSEYVETVALGTTVWTAFGACVPGRSGLSGGHFPPDAGGARPC